MKAPAPDTFKLVKEHARPAATFAVARVPDTDRVFLGSADFKVSEGDLAAAKFEPKDLYAHESYVTGVALAGKTLVSGGYDGKLVWWDTEKKAELRRTDAHAKWVRKVVASADGKLVASVADDMVGKLWDAATGKMLFELKGHAEQTPNKYGSMLYAAAFSADGKYLATGDKIGHVIVWDTATGKKAGELDAPVMYTWDVTQRMHSIGGIRSLAFSPDGKQLAVGGMGKVGNIDHLEGKSRVEVFDWSAAKQVAEFNGDKFNGLVNALRWAADGSWLFAAGGANEGFYYFLDVPAKKVLKQDKLAMHVHEATLTDAADSVVLVGHNKVSLYKLG